MPMPPPQGPPPGPARRDVVHEHEGGGESSRKRGRDAEGHPTADSGATSGHLGGGNGSVTSSDDDDASTRERPCGEESYPAAAALVALHPDPEDKDSWPAAHGCAGHGTSCFWHARKVWAENCCACNCRNVMVHQKTYLCASCFDGQVRNAGWPCKSVQCTLRYALVREIRQLRYQQASAQQARFAGMPAHGGQPQPSGVWAPTFDDDTVQPPPPPEEPPRPPDPQPHVPQTPWHHAPYSASPAASVRGPPWQTPPQTSAASSAGCGSGPSVGPPWETPPHTSPFVQPGPFGSQWRPPQQPPRYEPHPFSVWSPPWGLPPDGLPRIPYGIPPVWVRPPEYHQMYQWWRSSGRFMHARESLKECLQFIKAVHPDKLVPLPGKPAVMPEQYAAATAATTEANAVRDWIRVQGQQCDEL